MSVFKRLHLLDFTLLFFCAILTGIISGGMMNTFNGWLSPKYFQFFFYRNGTSSWPAEELYLHTIRQGCKEGLWFGCWVATIFTGYVFIVTRAGCRFMTAAPYLLKMAIVAFALWAMGGIDGLIYAKFFPQALNIILGIGGSRADAFKFIWVGGSINGSYFGSLLSVIVGCIWFKKDWNRRLKSV